MALRNCMLWDGGSCCWWTRNNSTIILFAIPGRRHYCSRVAIRCFPETGEPYQSARITAWRVCVRKFDGNLCANICNPLWCLPEATCVSVGMFGSWGWVCRDVVIFRWQIRHHWRCGGPILRNLSATLRPQSPVCLPVRHRCAYAHHGRYKCCWHRIFESPGNVFFGPPNVDTLRLPVVIADNWFLWNLYHGGIVLTALFAAGCIFTMCEASVAPAFGRSVLLLLGFVLAEGVARESLFFFSSIVLFFVFGAAYAEMSSTAPVSQNSLRKGRRILRFGLFSKGNNTQGKMRKRRG
jgi:hypothetical protein